MKKLPKNVIENLRCSKKRKQAELIMILVNYNSGTSTIKHKEQRGFRKIGDQTPSNEYDKKKKLPK